MMNKKYIPVVVLGLIGFFDSLYLTLQHFAESSVICNGVSECDLVLTSSYASIFGMPTALLGVIYYISITILFSLLLENKLTRHTNKILIITILGLLFSIWFVYLQAFVINAYCTYCLISALTSTLIFTYSAYIYYSNK